LLWAIDKKVVRYVLERHGRLLEIPVRVTFEYAIENGAVVNESLTIKTLFNEAAVLRRFPDLTPEELNTEICTSMLQEIHEHLALSGYTHSV